MDLKIMLLDKVVNSGINSPELVNYNFLGLYKKITETQGLVSSIEYYLEFDGEATYTDLYVRESFVYTFNGTIFTQIDTTIEWIDTDDLTGLSVINPKVLTEVESIDLGVLKRKNLLGRATFYSLQQLDQPNSTDLLQTLSSEIYNYTRGTDTTVLTNAVTALVGVKVYLTAPIAAGINAILSDI